MDDRKPSNEVDSQNQPAIIPDASLMEAMAEFAAGAGHEINNPLATIIGRAQLLLKDEKDPHRRQMLQAIGAQAYRIRDMIGDAMLFGRPPKPQFADVRLKEIVQRVVERSGQLLADSKCCVAIEISDDLTLLADSSQCSIVMAELIRNACQAMLPAGGEISICGRLFDDDQCLIEIKDSGKGFSEHERIHAFDPFFSGRQAGRGLGFGLSKCWQILRLHNGTIEIESSPRDSNSDHRTIVRLLWPTCSI